MIGALILAAAQCLPTPQAHAELRDKHGETRVMAGLTERGTIIEMWASPEGGWTVLATRPDGMSCLIEAGTSSAVYAVEKPGEPA